MNKKLTAKLEEKILELNASGVKKDDIAKMVGLSRITIFKVLKNYRTPEVFIEENKNNMNLLNLISFRLIYYCNDYKLLCKMFADAVMRKKPKKIIITQKLKNIIPPKKINKIISIIDYLKMDTKVEYSLK